MKLIAVFGFLTAFATGAHAQSTPPLAAVVATCGAQTYTAGSNRPVTQDTTGNQCSAATTTPVGTQDTNLKQVNSATVNVGPGASGTGTQRVTTSTDSTIGTVTAVTAITNALPAGSNVIGHVLADSGSITAVTQATPSNLNAQVTGTTAAAATFPTNPLGNGCRAATAAPTAVTDGQLIADQCGAEGARVIRPYSIKELMVRGSGSGTDNAAHSIIASAGGSLKNYITSMQCSNTSSTTTTVTMSDSASSVFIVPALGGTNATFPVPLVTAAATAFTFTAATGVTTMTCNAQGYTGL